MPESELVVREQQSVVAYTVDQVDLIKRTVAKGATDDELDWFLYQAKHAGLDPLAKQIYAVMRWDAQAQRNVMTVQTGIDGYRLIAQRTGEYVGNDEPEYGPEDKDGYPQWARVTVHRWVKGEGRAFTAIARWKEYVQITKAGVTRMWGRMPYLMLGKCAEALALRKAFPAELGGIYTNEEMMQADSEPIVVATVRPVETKMTAPAPRVAAPPPPPPQEEPPEEPPVEGEIVDKTLFGSALDAALKAYGDLRKTNERHNAFWLGGSLKKHFGRDAIGDLTIPQLGLFAWYCGELAKPGLDKKAQEALSAELDTKIDGLRSMPEGLEN